MPSDPEPGPASRLRRRAVLLIVPVIAGILATMAEAQPRAHLAPQVALPQVAITPVEGARTSSSPAFVRLRAGRHTRWQADLVRAQAGDGVDARAVALPSAYPRLAAPRVIAGDRIPDSTRARSLPSVRSADSIRAPPRA